MATEYPIFDVTYLSKKNELKECDSIQFTDEDHEYICHNKYFDMELSNNPSSYAENGGGIHYCSMKSGSSIKDDMFEDNMAKKAAWTMTTDEYKERVDSDPTYKFFQCHTIKQMKSAMYGNAAELGTKMHLHFEFLANIYQQQVDAIKAGQNRLTVEELFDIYFKNTPMVTETKYFFEFVDKFMKGKEFYRTELKLYDPVLNLCGAIDCLVYDKERDGYIIVDWKRTSGIYKGPKEPNYEKTHLFGKYLESWNKLYSCNWNHYQIQQHIYGHILREVYGFNVIGLYLVCINPKKFGKPDCLTLEPIPMLGDVRKAVDDLFKARAECILYEYGENLRPVHTQAIKDRIQVIENTKYEQVQDDEEAQSQDTRPKKKLKV